MLSELYFLNRKTLKPLTEKFQMSMFDPDTFLATSSTEALDTTVLPIPEGDYAATIDSGDDGISVRQFESSKNNQTYTAMDVWWIIDDAALASQLGRKVLRVKQSIFLDVTASGGLDYAKGKNVQLGRVRDAVGQNRPGQPWTPSMLKGAGPARIKVIHRMNGEDLFAEVKSVVKV